MKNASQILRDSLELLGPNGERWGQGASRRERGQMCPIDVLGSCAYKETTLLRRAIGLECGTYIADWNDSPSRHWPEVRQAFLKAIELAEAGA